MIKKLAACIGEYKKSTLLAPIFIAFEVVLEVIIPLLMAKLIDDGINSGNMKKILVIGGILVLVCALSLLCGTLSGRFAAIASSGFAKNMRREMYYRVQNFSFTNIDKFSTASIVTRLTTDVTNVQNAFQMIIRIAVRAPAMLLFSLIMAFTINGKLPVVFLAAVPSLAIGLFLIISNAHPIFERVFKTYDKLNNVVQENLRAIRVVKAFVREDHETGKFKKVSNDIYNDFTKAEKLIAFNGPLMQFCMYGCMIAISWFGAKMIVGGTLTTGELMSMITYIMQILMSLMMLSMIFVMITISRASAERIAEVLSEESDISNCDNPVMEVANGDISFKDVVFRYSRNAEKNCLEHINIDIKSGQTVGIIGGTGSSKSTFVQLIPRLYDVSEGCVEVGDMDVRNYDIHALRNEVAMVLQKNELFSGTIKENLRWGDENANDEELIRVCKLAQADDFIMAFPDKYDTYIEQGGTNVSGGQKQRICIARALLKKPKILILDDSTSAVDTHTDSLIRKAMREEIPDTTKIIIAQRISSVQDADMIIVLDDGKIADCGNHEELLKTSEIYREVYTSQMKEDDSDGR